MTLVLEMTIIMVVMARRQPYSLIYAPQVQQHLQAIERKHHAVIRKTIEEQLLFEPNVETTNRKPLREALLDAGWELRCGPKNRFRVFYEIEIESREVRILAIGVKERERLFVGGEEVQL